MTNKKVTKRTLLASCLSIVLCIAMLIGTTFAWFSDSVVNTGNKIQAGTLNISLFEKQADGTYADISDSNTPLFSYTKWEPGYTAVKDLQLHTNGTLALRYQVVIKGLETLDAATTKDIQNVLDVTVNGVKIGTLADFVSGTAAIFTGTMIPDENKTSADLNVQIHMQEDAGNDYQGAILPDFDVQIDASQYPYEKDGFGSNQYDASALPAFNLVATTPVTVTDGVVVETVIEKENVVVTIPPTVQVAGNALKEDTTLKLSVTSTNTDPTFAVTAGTANADTVDISLTDNKGNPVTAVSDKITVEVQLEAGLYNVVVLHNGEKMDAADYTYDFATGLLTIRASSFSPYTVGYNYEKNIANWYDLADTSWYDASATTFTVNNAKELAGLAQLVNGGNTFAKKTVQLGADINLTGKEWTPIGTSAKTFNGTFNGNDHIISGLNLKIAVAYGGLFAKTSGATIKNFTIDNSTLQCSIYNSYAGIVVGNAFTGTIANVHVKNAEMALSGCRYVGGITGHSYAAISHCSFEGKITSTSSAQVGGIVGSYPGKSISDCYVDATYTGGCNAFGGIVGFLQFESSATVNNCFVKGSYQSSGTSHNDSLGGIVGYAYNSGSDLKITNCYFDGTLSYKGAPDYAPTILGECGGDLYDATTGVAITSATYSDAAYDSYKKDELVQSISNCGWNTQKINTTSYRVSLYQNIPGNTIVNNTDKTYSFDFATWSMVIQ